MHIFVCSRSYKLHPAMQGGFLVHIFVCSRSYKLCGMYVVGCEVWDLGCRVWGRGV